MFEAAPHPDLLKFAIAALAAAMAALFLVLDRRRRSREQTARSWPVTDGVVANARTARRWGLGTGIWMAGLWYVPEISYRYEVAGEKYTGRHVFLADTGFSKLRKAKDVIDRYPRGANVQVHFDPKAPARACLEPVYRERRTLGIAIVLLTVAAAALLA
jgi:hypothetical protein